MFPTFRQDSPKCFQSTLNKAQCAFSSAVEYGAGKPLLLSLFEWEKLFGISIFFWSSTVLIIVMTPFSEILHGFVALTLPVIAK